MGSGAVYREITVKSALTRVQGMPFAWSLNPYYGCERACTYCYARDYHARRGRDTGAGFDREIDVKINFPELLAQELRRLRKRETVALGTATDPYQQCEGRYRITRRTLEALVACPLPLIVSPKRDRSRCGSADASLREGAEHRYGLEKMPGLRAHASRPGTFGSVSRLVSADRRGVLPRRSSRLTDSEAHARGRARRKERARSSRHGR